MDIERGQIEDTVFKIIKHEENKLDGAKNKYV